MELNECAVRVCLLQINDELKNSTKGMEKTIFIKSYVIWKWRIFIDEMKFFYSTVRLTRFAEFSLDRSKGGFCCVNIVMILKPCRSDFRFIFSFLINFYRLFAFCNFPSVQSGGKQRLEFYIEIWLIRWQSMKLFEITKSRKQFKILREGNFPLKISSIYHKIYQSRHFKVLLRYLFTLKIIDGDGRFKGSWEKQKLFTGENEEF